LEFEEFFVGDHRGGWETGNWWWCNGVASGVNGVEVRRAEEEGKMESKEQAKVDKREEEDE
jgi:hypothetical protein